MIHLSFLSSNLPHLVRMGLAYSVHPTTLQDLVFCLIHESEHEEIRGERDAETAWCNAE